MNKEHLEKIDYVDVALISSNPWQPRKHFDEEALIDLKESILEHGILSPLLVTKADKGYFLVAGERRLRAAKLAGLQEVPVIVRDFEQKTMAELAIIENIQRENLSPIEEALAYQELIDEYGYTALTLAERMGKSRAYVANLIRLLKLPERLKTYVLENKLSGGHARALLSLNDEDSMLDMAELVIKNGLSVRALESLVKESVFSFNLEKNVKKNQKKKPKNKSNYLAHVERQLEEYLQTKVNIQKGKKEGQVNIRFYGEEDLTRLLEQIGLETY